MSELIDNSRARIQSLKEIILELHRGADPESLKEQFGGLLAEVGASEIAAMESELMAGGMPQAEVQRMCDVHAAVLGDAVRSREADEAPAGHPVHTFRLENERIRQLVGACRCAVDDAVAGTEGALGAWREVHDGLRGIETHYLRKEYLVFPFLEKAGIAGPPKVMWGVHDEIRDKLAAAGEVLEGAEELDREGLALAADTVVRPMLDQVEGMTDKEDRILWPMCMAHLTVAQWQEVREQWDEFGEGLARPAGVWLPVLPAVPEITAEVASDDAIRMPSGHLSLRQLVAVFNALPVDLTFVDAEGRVAWFSEGPDRVFARNRAVIGRRVEDCHPPKSVHLVQQVVDELRSGRREVAEFWIQLAGRFVHIRYFPVRDEHGEFLGTLEVTQDIAPLRQLEGERRLLAEANQGGVS